MTLFPNRFQFTSPSKLHDAWAFRARLRFYLCLLSLYLFLLHILVHCSNEIGVGWLVFFIRCYIVLLGSNRIAAWKRYICFYCRSTGCVRKVHKHIYFVHLPQSTEIRVIFFSLLCFFFAAEHRVEKFSSLLPFDISSTFFFDFYPKVRGGCFRAKWHKFIHYLLFFSTCR